MKHRMYKSRPTIRLLAFCSAVLLAFPTRFAAAAGYVDRPEVQQFITRMVQQDGFDKAWLEQVFAAAQKRDAILTAIAKPYESRPWYQYNALFVTDRRITAGVSFWEQHRAELQKAEAVYGIPASLIVAILGVESFYGHQKGGYPVLDALTTLSFDYPPRAAFFQGELEQYLLMCREQAFDPRIPTGSYAGAMGVPQFMPDSYRQYAVTFDGMGKPDIWNDWADIIGSVANFFHAHGWQQDGLVAVPAALPQNMPLPADTANYAPVTVAALREQHVFLSAGVPDDEEAILVPLQLQHGTDYWVGLHNFRVLTQYNKSALYAMAVISLGRRIAQARAELAHSAPP